MDGFTFAPGQCGALQLEVLNAFRRHGWFHLNFTYDTPPDAGAQRLSASWMVSRAIDDGLVRKVNACSTPFGVMDGFTHDTGACLRPTPGAQRLSASWMVSQLQALVKVGQELGCSTPFGVMDGFTGLQEPRRRT